MMKHTLNAKVLGLSIANLLSLAALLGALVGATSAGAEGPASRDLILDLGDHASVGLASLESSASGNAFNLSGPAGGAATSSGIQVSGDGNWSAHYGVNAIALNTGSASIQNVTVVIGGNIVLQSASSDAPGS
jgi:hypothetical protein